MIKKLKIFIVVVEVMVLMKESVEDVIVKRDGSFVIFDKNIEEGNDNKFFFFLVIDLMWNW